MADIGLHFLEFSDRRPARGPDGGGWNRLAIHSMTPMPRCALRPLSRQAAIDTARGMARAGEPNWYGLCEPLGSNCGECKRCARSIEPEAEWHPEWCIREDSHNHVWLLGSRELMFAGRGYVYGSWEALFRSIAVPELKRMEDANGFYWVAAQSAPKPNQPFTNPNRLEMRL